MNMSASVWASEVKMINDAPKNDEVSEDHKFKKRTFHGPPPRKIRLLCEGSAFDTDPCTACWSVLASRGANACAVNIQRVS